MRHLLGTEPLSREEALVLLSRAQAHKAALARGSVPRALSGRAVANLFFEDSTRTRSSFELAAKWLGAEVLNWTVRGSSASKGEGFRDTVRNVAALGVSALVIRHESSGAAELAAREVRCAVVNAGDGTHEHPTQALLDAFTLTERFGSVEGKRVLIVGDVLHSRVARSNIFLLTTLGAKVVCCAPPTLMPAGLDGLCETHGRLDDVVGDADAVMLLRVQLERQEQGLFPSGGEYARLFQLNSARVQRMKPSAVVMHPGPINRGLELAPDVADGDRSVILEQVANGVPVRMAVLEWCLS